MFKLVNYFSSIYPPDRFTVKGSKQNFKTKATIARLWINIHKSMSEY